MVKNLDSFNRSDARSRNNPGNSNAFGLTKEQKRANKAELEDLVKSGKVFWVPIKRNGNDGDGTDGSGELTIGQQIKFDIFKGYNFIPDGQIRFLQVPNKVSPLVWSALRNRFHKSRSGKGKKTKAETANNYHGRYTIEVLSEPGNGGLSHKKFGNYFLARCVPVAKAK